MKKNVYKCMSCGYQFEVDPQNARGQVCEKCGSMNIKFVKVKNAEK